MFDWTRKISINIFKTISGIADILKNMPTQIEREQPVILIDALNRLMPFHLEFIRSPELYAHIRTYGPYLLIDADRA